MSRSLPGLSALLALLLVLAACGGSSSAPASSGAPSGGGNNQPPVVDVQNLYSLAPAGMPIGVAVPAGTAPNSVLTSMIRQDIVTAHFSQVTAENIMKPSFLQPTEGTFLFADADELVSYAAAHGKSVHGHTLLWHNQLPDWMRNFSGDSNAFAAMMSNHIASIAAHFAAADIVVSWDVVNEAFADQDRDGDGVYDLRETLWYDNIGPGYLPLAYRTAAAADPNAELYYNDYNIAGVPAKLDAVLKLVDEFRNDPDPVPVHGIGFQMHVSLSWPPLEQIEQSFALAASTGLKIKISELDVTVNLDSSGNPMSLTELSAAVAEQQAQRYQEIVTAYLEAVPAAQRGGISVWGIADIDSWRRYNTDFEWPLLFDDRFAAKPALQGFADALSGDQVP